jgi:hypothetical protein
VCSCYCFQHWGRNGHPTAIIVRVRELFLSEGSGTTGVGVYLSETLLFLSVVFLSQLFLATALVLIAALHS